MMVKGEAQPAGPVDDLPDADEEARHQPWLRWILLAIVLLLAALWLLAFRAVPTLEDIVNGRQAALDYVEAHLAVALAGLLIANAIIAILSVPGGSILTIAGGMVFGGAVGGAVTVAGAMLGSVLVYLLVRTAFAGVMRKWVAAAGPRIARLTARFRRNAFNLIVIMRLVPFVPYWIANGIPALLDIRMRVFIPASLIGLLPWTVGFAFFGQAVGDVIAAQDVETGCLAESCSLDLSALTSGPVLTAVALAALAMVPLVASWLVNRAR